MDILVISSYPQKGTTHGAETVGIASYTKNTLYHLKKLYPNFSCTVLAEILDSKDTYTEQGLTVKRVWKRNNFLSIVRLSTYIVSSKTEIFIPFEVYMFGHAFYGAVFLAMLVFFRIFGKRYIIVLHQVADDISAAETNTFRARVFPYIKHLLYGVIIGISHRVVVFEEIFKKRLGEHKNISVIPHAVESMDCIPQDTARARLNLDSNKRYLLYFGFLSPYKGIDRLIDSWQEQDEWQLIIAGGGNPNYANDEKYQRYMHSLLVKAKDKNIHVSGYVPESQIADYFCAADALILPYTVFFSSSGPLSLAFASEKPILISEELKDYFKTYDFKNSLKNIDLTADDLIVSFESHKLYEKLQNISKHKSAYITFSRAMKQYRSWQTLARDYAKSLTLSQE